MAKGDVVVISYVLLFMFFSGLFLVGAYKIGVMAEKVRELEDVVFTGKYKIVKVD